MASNVSLSASDPGFIPADQASFRLLPGEIASPFLSAFGITRSDANTDLNWFGKVQDLIRILDRTHAMRDHHNRHATF